MSIKLKHPEGRQIDKAFADFAERMLSEAGVTQEQADRIYTAYQAHVDQWMETDTLRVEAVRKQEIDALRSQWGDQFDTHLAAGRKAAASLGLDTKALQALDRSIGISATANLLAKIGSRTVTNADTGETRITVLSAEEAKAEVSRMQGDKAFQDQLRNTKDPVGRAAALAKWNDAHAAAYPAASSSPAPKPSASSNAPMGRDAALARLNELRADTGFIATVFDKTHPQHEANTATWVATQEAAYAPDPAPASASQ